MKHQGQNSVRIVEVGPRDGLQNIKEFIATDHKAALIRKLIAAGCRRIEVTSFVRRDLVPQMKDAEAVCVALPHTEGVRYAALVANREGLDRALAAGVEEISIVVAASETFNRKNVKRSIDDSIAEYREIITSAHQHGVLVRGYVSTAFWCPYEGRIMPQQVLDVTTRLFELGVYEVSLADTIGAAQPHEVSALLAVIFSKYHPDTLALHLHDTRGNALANIQRGYANDIRTFDSSVGGLGGCPFANVCVGNVATEDVVDLFEREGISTGIDLATLVHASRFVEGILGHELPSRYLRSARSR